VRPDVSGHERFEQGAAIVVESPLLHQDLGHGATLGESPSLKGGDQRGLVDHPVLEGEQAEKEATRSVGAIGHGRISRPRVGRDGGKARLQLDAFLRMRGPAGRRSRYSKTSAK
jgi:hypothetical protein